MRFALDPRLDLKEALKEAVASAVITAILTFPVIGLRLDSQSSGLVLSHHFLFPALATAFIFFAKLLWSFYGYAMPHLTWRWAHPVLAVQSKLPLGVTQRWNVFGVVIILIAAVALPFTPMGERLLYPLTMATIYMLLALGLNIVVGYAGLLDLGHAAFYAIGAYAYAIINQYLGWSFWECLPLAAIITAIAGLMLGFPVLRLRGDYLAIVTLGFGEIVRLLLKNLSQWTGGPDGITGIPKPTLFGYELTKRASDGGQTLWDAIGIPYSSPHQYIVLYFIGLAMVIISYLVISRLIRMPIGRAWEALREDEVACRSVGLSPTTIKLAAFALGSMFAGIAGAFCAGVWGTVIPDSFTFMESAIILSIVVLGGMGSQRGVLLAALILTLLPEVARGFAQYRMLIFGLVMVLMMIWRPQGLWPTPRRKVELPS
jgi:branched-chain amino acid transport system permease protein